MNQLNHSSPSEPVPSLLTYARIDLDAIAHNARELKRHVGPSVHLVAVVKANAYGHGALEVAQVALAHGATWLAVARVAEGVQLRQAGMSAPILVMGYFLPSEAEAVAAYDLTATVNSAEVARALSGQAQRLGRSVTVHVKVDTGMGRFGLLPAEVLPFLAGISAMPGLEVEGLWSHFATADARDKTYAHQQFATFLQVIQAVEDAGYAISMRHIANSGILFDLPATHLDAVRPGILLFGLHPSDEVTPTILLRPALSLVSHVGRVRTLPAGSSISYGRTYTTTRPTPVALVPIGYGDGYHRLLSNRGAVLIRGQRAPIVGRVCMDNIVVDVTGIQGVQEGDEVVLIGPQGEDYISAEEVAAWAETINYEVTTSLLPRLPRIYT